MNVKERIQFLCKKNGITSKSLEEHLGFGKGYISKIDKAAPNLSKIKPIADYFGVTVDYLMTGKEDDNIQRKYSNIMNIITYLKNSGTLDKCCSEETVKEIEKLVNELSLSKENSEEDKLLKHYRNDKYFKVFMNYYMSLNDIGKKKALDNVSDLSKIYNIDYTMHIEPNAAHQRTDIETTEEMKQHDDDIMKDPDF